MTSTQMNFNEHLDLYTEENERMENNGEVSGNGGGIDVMSPMSGGSETRFLSFDKTLMLGDVSMVDTFNEIRKLVEDRRSLRVK